MSALEEGQQAPTTSHGDEIVEIVRQRIAVEDNVLAAGRDRRDRVAAAAEDFVGAQRTFGSGSLAHRTMNRPLKDADLGVVLDRRSWLSVGPDGESGRPEPVMEELGRFVLEDLLDEYPDATYDADNRRAILFTFNETVNGVDPTVDLVICLTRKDAPGFWIPNAKTEQGWDPSDPETHTRLMTAEPKDLRVHRARVIRLAKAAVGNDVTPVVFSWNLSALALIYITETRASLLDSLTWFFTAAAGDILTRLTPDPADVAAPIGLPDGVDQHRAAARLLAFARHCEAAGHMRSRQGALAELAFVFGPQLPEAPRSDRMQIADALRGTGPVAPAVAAFGEMPKRTPSHGRA